jgi:peroxidase
LTAGRLLPRLSLKGGAVKFTAGEGRATENPGLATVHTIFMREHNRVATAIAATNSLLTDDQVSFGLAF